MQARVTWLARSTRPNYRHSTLNKIVCSVLHSSRFLYPQTGFSKPANALGLSQQEPVYLARLMLYSQPIRCSAELGTSPLPSAEPAPQCHGRMKLCGLEGRRGFAGPREVNSSGPSTRRPIHIVLRSEGQWHPAMTRCPERYLRDFRALPRNSCILTGLDCHPAGSGRR